MRIALACSGQKLSDPVDPQFGRCNYFLIVDPETKDFKAIKNTGVQAFRGAGVSAAQLVANQKVQAVAAGNFGPKAVAVLTSSGINIFTAPASLTVEQAVEKYQKGELKELNS